MATDVEGSAAQIFVALAATAVARSLFSLYVGWQRSRKFVRVGRVSGLWLYPIKSCAGIPLESAQATALGLRAEGIADRHWLVVRENGDFVTQRQHPRLALVRATQHPGRPQTLTCTAPDLPPLALPISPPLERGLVRQCRVWGAHLEGLDCGEEAAAWFSKLLGLEGVRLLFSAPSLFKRHCADESKPWGNPARPGDQAAFADFGAYLVTSEASLNDVNKQLKSPVTMRTFRPNIVLADCSPFEEDKWSELKIGNVNLRMLDPCTRCVMTTVNPDTGVKSANSEPLETLKRIRCFPEYGKSPLFGVNATADVPGVIRVGDPVFAIRKP